MSFTSNMYIYSICLSISGFFSATFALTFAYISDCVEVKRRAPAFGLALATFGLSFTMGPMLGSYLAEEFGARYVFLLSLLLTAVNVVYVVTKLPETAKAMDVRTLTISHLSVSTRRSSLQIPASLNLQVLDHALLF